MERFASVEQSILARTPSPLAKQRLAAFFNTLSQVHAFEEAQRESDAVRRDESDGVRCRDIEELDTAQRDKIDHLTAANVFKPADQQEVVVVAPKPEPPPRIVKPVEGINRRGKYGYTCLHRAVMAHNLPEVKSLVSQGAMWNIGDNGGQTAWDKAYFRGYDDILLHLKPDFVRLEAAVSFED